LKEKNESRIKRVIFSLFGAILLLKREKQKTKHVFCMQRTECTCQRWFAKFRVSDFLSISSEHFYIRFSHIQCLEISEHVLWNCSEWIPINQNYS